MYFLKLLKENIFLFLFFVFAFSYGYSLIVVNNGLIYVLKPFIVPSLVLHYVINVEEKNNFYIIALFFAFLGDLFFSIPTEDGFLIAMSSFVIFNLFIMIIVSESAGEIKISNLFLSMMPFLILLFIIINYLFSKLGAKSILLTIYGVILVFLCTFSLYYYIKTRSKMALYFLLGSLLFVLAGVSKGLKEFDVDTSFLKIMNNVSYTFSLYFYYRAMTAKRVVIDKPQLQGEKSITY